MDYEEKYKSALKWMQSLYGGLHGATKEEAEKYFPELKESEDEKIRKDIIRVFKGEISFTSEKESKKYIAWLEKQGHMLDPDKVIEWLKAKVYDDSTYGMAMIDKFKKDFGL